MKYLKLFEVYEPLDRTVGKIIKKSIDDRVKAIKEYKELVDEFMYEITDDYESKCEIAYIDYVLKNSSNVDYLNYTFYFDSDQVEPFFKSLYDVVKRLHDSNGIKVTIDLNAISRGYMFPYDIEYAEKYFKAIKADKEVGFFLKITL